MKNDEKCNTGFKFKVDEKIKARALEVLGESQAMQYAEGLRIGGALTAVFDREYARNERKYGKDHLRTLQVAARAEANAELKKSLFARYTDASTPQTDPGKGWAVDGFVRTADGDPVPSVTVAAFDQQERWYQELGYSCTDERGYFSVVVEKLSDKPPSQVFMRALKGKNLLPSSIPQVAPAPGSADRVEIIIDEGGDKGDCMPPDGKKGAGYPPYEPSRGKDANPPLSKEKSKEEPKISAVSGSKKPDPKKSDK